MLHYDEASSSSANCEPSTAKNPCGSEAESDDFCSKSVDMALFTRISCTYPLGRQPTGSLLKEDDETEDVVDWLVDALVETLDNPGPDEVKVVDERGVVVESSLAAAGSLLIVMIAGALLPSAILSRFPIIPASPLAFWTAPEQLVNSLDDAATDFDAG